MLEFHLCSSSIATLSIPQLNWWSDYRNRKSHAQILACFIVHTLSNIYINPSTRIRQASWAYVIVIGRYTDYCITSKECPDCVLALRGGKKNQWIHLLVWKAQAAEHALPLHMRKLHMTQLHNSNHRTTSRISHVRILAFFWCHKQSTPDIPNRGSGLTTFTH